VLDNKDLERGFHCVLEAVLMPFFGMLAKVELAI